MDEFAIVIKYGRAVQQYISYITGVDEKTLWGDRLMDPSYIADFKADTTYRLTLEMVDRGHILNPVLCHSPVFGAALTQAANDIRTLYGMLLKSPGITEAFRESRLGLDRDTTMVAYVPSRAVEIRDLPRRLGFVLKPEGSP